MIQVRFAIYGVLWWLARKAHPGRATDGSCAVSCSVTTANTTGTGNIAIGNPALR